MKRVGMTLMMGALLLALSASVALAVNRSGGPGNDLLRGTDASDSLDGNRGNDALYGFASPDGLFGDFGDDTVRSGVGNDLARGGPGGDLVRGGAGDELPTEGIAAGVYGGPDNDAVGGSKEMISSSEAPAATPSTAVRATTSSTEPA